MKPLYTISPAAWDRAKRVDQSRADHANPFIGFHRPPTLGTAIGWTVIGLIGLLGLVHLVAWMATRITT